MKLIYVAGAYRGRNRDHVAQSIAEARQRGVECVKVTQQCYPVIPHMNTAHFEDNFRCECHPDRFWLEGTIQLMRKCDAVLLVTPEADGVSSGTKAEVEEATRLGIPVFRALADLYDWEQAEIERNKPVNSQAVL